MQEARLLMVEKGWTYRKTWWKGRLWTAERFKLGQINTETG